MVLDVCGAGATRFRDEKCQEILDAVEVSIIKGNSSEVARIAGEDVKTGGLMPQISDQTYWGWPILLPRSEVALVITGKDDIVADMKRAIWVHNGHPMMANVVGTGCMATSVIGAFAAVETDHVVASVSGLICYEVAAEIAALVAAGPGSFKEREPL